MHQLSTAALIITLPAACGLGEQAYLDPGLEHGSKNPPDSAKPRV
jgi:hypothetical protein